MLTSRVRGVARDNYSNDDDDEDSSAPAFANVRWDEDEEEDEMMIERQGSSVHRKGGRALEGGW